MKNSDAAVAIAAIVAGALIIIVACCIGASFLTNVPT